MRATLTFLLLLPLLGIAPAAADPLGDGGLTSSLLLGGHRLEQDRRGGTGSGAWRATDSAPRIGLAVDGSLFVAGGPVGLEGSLELFERHKPSAPAAAGFGRRPDGRYDARAVARLALDPSALLAVRVGYGHRNAFAWASHAGGLVLEYRLALHSVTAALAVCASPVDGLGVEAELSTGVILAGAARGIGEIGLEVMARVRVHPRLLLQLGGSVRTETARSDLDGSSPVTITTTSALARVGAGMAF